MCEQRGRNAAPTAFGGWFLPQVELIQSHVFVFMVATSATAWAQLKKEHRGALK
jgi:hypothetical protein